MLCQLCVLYCSIHSSLRASLAVPSCRVDPLTRQLAGSCSLVCILHLLRSRHDSTTTPLTTAPGMCLLLMVPGDVFTCPVTLTNIGNVRLLQVSLTQPAGNDCNADLMAPGERRMCKVFHVVTAEETAAGKFRLNVRATGTPRGSVAVLPPVQPDQVDVSLTGAPGLDVSVASSPATPVEPNKPVEVEVTVWNTGYAPVANVALKLDNAAMPCDITTLPVGGSSTCKTSLVVGQDAFDSGAQLVSVTAFGSVPGVSLNAGTQLLLMPAQRGQLAVAFGECEAPQAAGGSASCEVQLRNQGTVRLIDVSIPGAATACKADVLNPGAAKTCVLTALVSQADFDAADTQGKPVTLSVTARATPNVNGAAPVEASGSQSVPLPMVRSATILSAVNPTTVVVAGERGIKDL